MNTHLINNDFDGNCFTLNSGNVTCGIPVIQEGEKLEVRAWRAHELLSFEEGGPDVEALTEANGTLLLNSASLRDQNIIARRRDMSCLLYVKDGSNSRLVRIAVNTRYEHQGIVVFNERGCLTKRESSLAVAA